MKECIIRLRTPCACLQRCGSLTTLWATNDNESRGVPFQLTTGFGPAAGAHYQAAARAIAAQQLEELSLAEDSKGKDDPNRTSATS